LQNAESVSKTPKPQRFGKMVAVFSRFSFIAQHKAFWIQHKKTETRQVASKAPDPKLDF